MEEESVPPDSVSSKSNTAECGSIMMNKIAQHVIVISGQGTPIFR